MYPLACILWAIPLIDVQVRVRIAPRIRQSNPRMATIRELPEGYEENARMDLLGESELTTEGIDNCHRESCGYAFDSNGQTC